MIATVEYSFERLMQRFAGAGAGSNGELAFFKYLLDGRVRDLLRNVSTQGAYIDLEDETLPLTINRREFGNSYVCSPYSAYVTYTREELGLLKNPFLIAGLRVVLGVSGLLLKMGRINRVVQVNNWLCSTNLYPHLKPGSLAQATSTLLKHYPDYAVMWRSLNYDTNPGLIEELKEQGYELFPARQVYLFDARDPSFKKKRMLQSDFSMLKKTDLVLVDHDDIGEADYERIEALYQNLYILKHSSLNPQMTADFIRLNHQHKLLTFKGLRDKSGILQGVIGYFEKAGVLATHLIGYNTDLPQEMGLYRMLSALLFREAIDKGLMLNFSSGAAHFKRLRGGKPVLEYTAIYNKHLPLLQRWSWSMLAWAARTIGAKVLVKFAL